MADNLVVVESPAKAKTIEKYLGAGYTVLASYGHIRDLPRSDFAVEVHDGGGCDLVYEVPEKSKKHVTALKKAAKGATVWLAPDLDREGEALASELRATLQSAQGAADSLNETLASVQPAAQRVNNETLPAAEATLRDLRATSTALRSITEKLEQQGATSLIGSPTLPDYEPE